MIPQSILDFFHAGKSLPFRSMTYFNILLEATFAGGRWGQQPSPDRLCRYA